MIVLASCHQEDKALKAVIVNADSVAINYFTGDGKVDSVTSVKIIRDKNIMQQLSDHITASQSEFKTGCGYDGTIHFFKNDKVVQDIKFRLNNTDCMQFSFIEDGQKAATLLSSEAKRFLTSLK